MVTKSKSKDNYCPKGMLVARILLSLIFISSVIGKITQFSSQAAWASTSWVPLPGELLIVVAILMELFGVVALISGWKMKEGAIVLIVYTFLATIMFHMPVDQAQTIAFLKNLGLIGGLLALSMLKPGKYSIN